MQNPRLDAAIDIIRAHGLDAGVLFSPETHYYLLGHDSFAGVNTPVALILSPRLDRPVVVIWAADAPMLPGSGEFLTVRTYQFGIDSPAAAIADALHRHVGPAARIGWDAQSAALNHALATEILAETKIAAPVDLSVPIARLRAFKTDAEVGFMREAGRMAEHGLRAARATALPGVSELSVAAGIEAALRRAGSDYWAVPIELASGTRAHHVHGTPVDRVLETGDLLHVEFAAVHRRYHAVGIQTLAVGGPPHARARWLHETARRCLAAGLAAARPGIPACEIENPALDILAAEGLGDTFAMRFGYSVGIGYPPTWLEPFGITRTNGDPVLPGMTFVLHTCLLEAASCSGVLVGGTYAMTPTGLFCLAGAGDTDLFIAGGA